MHRLSSMTCMKLQNRCGPQPSWPSTTLASLKLIAGRGPGQTQDIWNHVIESESMGGRFVNVRIGGVRGARYRELLSPGPSELQLSPSSGSDAASEEPGNMITLEA